MRVVSEHLSPNIRAQEIPVGFLVLHYTGCSLKKTLEIFLDPQRGVSSHFVIDVNGDCYDLARTLEGPVMRGAHAGVSRIQVDGVPFASLNDISIGIEIVNLNGNLFPYSEAQYRTLAELVTLLQKRHPALRNPSRIVGHEHIASFRGKADPGLRFDWDRFFTSVGLNGTELHRFHACSESDVQYLTERLLEARSPAPDADFWPSLSTELEQRIAARSSG